MKKVLATLLVLCMVVGMLPSMSFAADTTINAVRTAFFNSSGSEWKATDGDHVVVAAGADGWTGVTEFTDSDGTVTTHTSVTGSPFGSARNALIAFTIPADLDPNTVVKATLSMKIKNVKQTSSGARLSVYGNSVDGSWSTSSDKSIFGVNGSASGLASLPLLGLTDAIEAGNSKGEATSNQIITLSSHKLTDYICQVAEEGKTEVTFRLACNLGGIRIFDTTTSTPPTLTLTYGAKASVKLNVKDSDGELIKTDTIEGLYAGDSFKVTEDMAPMVIKEADGYCAREEIEVSLAAGENVINVTYSPIVIDSVASVLVHPVIKGGKAALPGTLSVTTDTSRELLVPVTWVQEGDTYKAEVGEFTATVTPEILSCDSSLSRFTSSGTSDGANFGAYNDIALSVGGGTAIFDTAFTVEGGTNMLIMYGDQSTTAFASAAALTRMFVNKNANGEYVFEYHNGDWVQSDVVCEYGAEYLLRTEVDVTNKTYNLYLSKNGDSFVQLNPSPCAFRGSNVTAIDRMFFSGDVKVTSFRSHWVDGYSMITVSPVNEEGENVADDYTLKCTTGSTYTANYLPKLIEQNGTLYIMEDVNYAPSIKVTGDSTLNVRYNEVTLASYDDIVTVVVQGDSTINLPSTVKLTFSDEQVITASVNWDTSDVDNDTVGEYEAIGTIEGLEETTITATVKVREVTNLPKTSENTVVTNNGGWNWYVEPSGTHIQPGDALATRYESGQYSSNNGYVFRHDKTYMGWVEDGGDIVIGEYNHDTDEYKRVVIHEKLESDDHNNPAVVILPDGRIMAVYTMHTNEAFVYYRVTKNPEDISEWNDEQFYLCQSVTPEDTNVYYATYPSVFMVHDDEGIIGNDVIYMGWRGVHWKPTFAKFSMPDEEGKCETVMHQTQFANTTYGYSTYDGNDAPNAKSDGGKTDSGRRPYTKYDYDFDRNKIYITFTANHPDNDKRNHIYYIYLDIEDQNLYTAKDRLLQPLPFENQQEYRTQGAAGTNGQWGIITVDLVDEYPELLVFNATEQTGQSFNPRTGNAERRGWTWDIAHNEKGEPCIVYVDVTATPPGEGGSLPTWYVGEVDGNSRSHHYYWYARWDSDTQEWVKTFLTYGGKWWHENASQERCYSGGLTLDHNAEDANVIYLSIPTMGEYGNMFEIYRWESEDHGATWTKREALTENSKACNARPNAIYNYKMDDDGSNAGPRLLWMQGEYRYWMNYEYKTGIMTDFAAGGFTTQDDPEMFADARLYMDGEKLEKLPVGEATITAKFNITNTSIGDGVVTAGLAHYNKDNILINVYLERDIEVPARSVPQTGIIGAPKREDGSLSRMGDDEIKPEIEYTATFSEGDKVKLLCWNMGIEHPYSSIMTTPFTMTTDGDGYIFKENFTYEGDELLVLDSNEDTFNGWVGNRYYDGRAEEFTDNCYAGIIKAPFGNTALHLYHKGDGGVMASHALPDTNGKDFELKFTIRYINELSWNNTQNAGFSLSNNIPGYANNIDGASCAFQFRHEVKWQDENGRGTNGYLRRTRWFDGNVLSHIFHGGIPRDMEIDGLERADYHKGVGYFDPEKGFYIHDYNDALMAGSLYYFTVKVSPSNKTVTMSIHDGYREITHTESYVDKDSYDWDNNPINAITFNIGNEKYGEMYVDDITMTVLE
ncbi:MAG: BNR-4 repeat-containing protein [Clostridia bacterium]|nr:BNR-4 repeat-containing protein [Clostridia bacterium]